MIRAESWLKKEPTNRTNEAMAATAADQMLTEFKDWIRNLTVEEADSLASTALKFIQMFEKVKHLNWLDNMTMTNDPKEAEHIHEMARYLGDLGPHVAQTWARAMMCLMAWTKMEYKEIDDFLGD